MEGLLGQVENRLNETESEGLAYQYEEALVLAEEIATNREGAQKLAETIAQSESVEEGLGHAAAILLMQVERRVELDGSVKMEFIGDVLEHVFEIANEMGLIEEADVTDSMIEQVVFIGTEFYAEMKEQMGEPLDIESMDGEIDDLDREGLIAEARQRLGDEKVDLLLQMASEGASVKQTQPHEEEQQQQRQPPQQQQV